MKNNLPRAAKKMNKNRRQRKWWQRTVRAMATAVVFCTTYALILPAITMERETICGVEAHEHTESCYAQQVAYPYVCEWDDQVKVVHSHDVYCSDAQGELICQLPEIEEHTHEDACYEQTLICELAHTHGEECNTTEDVLICTEEEYEAHTHDENCVTTEDVLICAEEEYEAHTHDENCVTTEDVLICAEEEYEAHTHDENCVTLETVLTCTVDEHEGHAHSEACAAVENVLICTVAESEGHAHSDACAGTEQVWVCANVEESHTHGEACYEEQTVPCELTESEGHTHGEACYEEQEIPCELTESEGHTHGEACYEEQEIPCELTESEGHTHGEACYEEQEIPCELMAGEGHAHDEACYEEQEILCELTEGEGHAHDETCYEEQEVPCELTENPDHVHTETCYELSEEPVCGKEEVVLHTHGEDCYDEEHVLTCTVPEVVVHNHTEDCLIESEPEEQTLICEIPEHIHEEACYPLESEENVGIEFHCGYADHQHAENCYDAEGVLTCTIPEHTHEAACIVEDLDLTADVETQEQWEATLNQLTLTGNWPKDVLAVAESQLNYKESIKNVVLEGDKLKGYTRYGDWYGDPYADWCAMYVSFCLRYAGVENYPLETGSNRWVEALTEQGLYLTADAYAAKPGDLIFFDFDQKRDAIEEIPIEADHVGIVVERIPATETEPAMIKTIEGNANDQVAYMTYELDDPAIIGYGRMPAGELIILEYQGADFAVTVNAAADAGIPETAQLDVREILPGTEEYETYYQQSVQTLFGQSTVQSMEELEISFARFFDISFLVEGVSVEPVAPVDIQIHYEQGFEMEEEDTGLVVHFADEGVEVLDANTHSSGSDQVDTFQFTQDSFSVSGTIVTYAARAANTYSTEKVNSLDASGNTQYVVYTKLGNDYYALDGNGNAVKITVEANGTISSTVTNNMLWTFTSDGAVNKHLIRNVGTRRYMHSYDNNTGEGVTTGGAYSSLLILDSDGSDIGFNVKSNSDYSQLIQSGNQVRFTVIQDGEDATKYYLAAVPQNTYHVWFDGTNGDLMGLHGSDNTYQAVPANDNSITLPATWKSPTKYAYKLNGWYDIVNNIWYAPGAWVTINQNTVFYADWIAADYDVGQKNEHTVSSLDTNDFITTYVFDYNSLFNVQSLTHLGSISATGHSEDWTMIQDGRVPYGNANTLDFAFLDYDVDANHISYPSNRNNFNNNRSVITTGVISHVDSVSGGKNLMDILFSHTTPVIGKYYVGTGNYLYQYMDSSTPNYDGHDGYYYFHSRLNSADYNQSEGRFYLYDYLERTSDSEKDGGPGEYSDFLPFNSIYKNYQNKTIGTYTDPVSGMTGYQFDAKDNGQGSAYNNAGTNYWFGIRSDVEFFLPNDAGDQDDYGNYGNISTKGEHMIFEFHGDDDVWVYIDDELVLDIGGVHGVEYGEIDFSTGVVTRGEGAEAVTLTFEELLGHKITEGTHVMKFYYMERGSSQSNSSIYFNIAPRYDLQITKEDIYTSDMLNGTQFTVYTDEACTQVAELWASHAAHLAGEASISHMTVVDGVAKAWGLSAGKTYYIKETYQPNDGYVLPVHDVIRITLNNRGTAEIETTNLHGPNGEYTEGYAVIEQNINDTLKLVALTVTNQKDDETTQIRVEKEWDINATDLPNSITAYLTLNGQRVGRPAVLTAANGWTYTWTGLPKYTLDENNVQVELEYRVEEIQVSGFETESVTTKDVPERIEWVQSESMEDRTTYLLLNGGRALAYDGNSFYWMAQTTAKHETDGLDAQWYVTTNEYGFRLRNGNGYYLTYSRGSGDTGDYFYGTTATTSGSAKLNQVIYYLENRLVAHDHDYYFQFNVGGDAVSSDGLVFNLIRKDIVSGTVVEIKNTLVENEAQTFVEVNKVWDDAGADHSNDSITVHLYADGVDTGRTLILNAANNWQGSFEGLAYYATDGVTPIVYSVVETEPDEYDALYDAETVPGHQIVTWVKQSNLTQSGIYRVVSGANALSIDADGNLAVGVNNTNDQLQWWTPVQNHGRTVLKSYTANRYLYMSGTTVSLVSNPDDAATVSLNGEIVTLSDDYLLGYLQMTRTSVTTSGSENNATLFTVALRTEATGMDGTAVTVTNIPERKYKLPNTGGMGTSTFTFGGLLMSAAALMYICKFGHKRQKGGRYAK